MQPKVYFASDHAGFELKNELIPLVRDILGYEVVDLGAYQYDTEDDFTTYIIKAAKEVSANPEGAKAIILGGSGQGEAMLANRLRGVRATVFYGGSEEIINLSRVHNDANVLSLGARFISLEEAKSAVALWLHTEHPPVEKYDRRIAQMDSLVEKKAQIAHNPELPLSLVPSLPAQSFDEVRALLDALDGTAQEIQVDIVDGKFVPFTSWPFTEQDPKEALKQLSMYEDFELEIDCMCLSPETYLDVFLSIGVDRVIVHAGSTKNYEACIAHKNEHGYYMGLGILNTTPHELVESLLPQFDYVQVMGIKEIGVQGQPFDETTLQTVKTLREKYPKLQIAIDGAVNESTIMRLKEAGANRFAPGSAIAKASDPKLAYKQLSALIGL